MTVEELELLQRHPRFPKRLVPMLLSELKRQRAIEEGAKGAAERGMDASAKDSAKLKAAVVKAISKLERSTSP
jgi:hypothetical protein